MALPSKLHHPNPTLYKVQQNKMQGRIVPQMFVWQCQILIFQMWQCPSHPLVCPHTLYWLHVATAVQSPLVS